VGPNGAGKTTIIKILAGLILADSGRVKVLNLDVIKDELKLKASVSLLTGEERSFYWRLTGRENLEFFGYLYNLSKNKIKKKIEELALILNIGEYLDRRFQEYSTGIKQRFSIARALLNDPKIIFMDEPTKNLDPLVAEATRNFIKNELKDNQNKTIFFATHNLKEAFSLGETIAIMDRGKIKAIDTPEGLKRNSGFEEPEEIFKYYVAK
ncbi:MAG: ABC transporter ATP-binding protein, partial [Candidatus Omnitrophica bacterium]|nr:ABC transporter ATP-binding protein [Candidatus Omnitrophota bacterium]